MKVSEHRIFLTGSVLSLSLLLIGDSFAQAPTPFPGFAGKSPISDKKDFVGEWEGYVTDGDGSNPGQRRMNISLAITKNKITSSGQGNMGEGAYKVSAGSGKLRRIDATGTAGQYQASSTRVSSLSKAIR